MQHRQQHHIVRNTNYTNSNKTALLIFLVTSLLLLLQAEPTLSSSTPRKSFLAKVFRRAKSKENKKDNNNMGQAMRIVQYDRAENERNAIPALSLTDGQDELKWHRLDDGVMGGQSETLHRVNNNNNNNENNDDSKTTTTLSFCGTINTNGGGFASIRAPLPDGLPEGTTAIRLLLRGDGKTYKLLLSDGNRSKFGPSRRSPSWQSDIPTTKDTTTESITLPLSGFCPSFSGGGPNRAKPETLPKQLEVREMRQIGVMLSLKRSDGSDNPIETFGTGIFPFSLEILSIQPIVDIDETAASSAAESS